MKLPSLLCLLLAFVASAQTHYLASQPGPGTYPHRAKQLRERGIFEPQQIHFSSLWPIYENDYRGMGEAAHVVVLVRCLDFRYRLSRDQTGIETLFNLEVKELLKGRVAGLSTRRFLPRLGVLAPGEIAVRKSGGVLKIDGILFTEVEAGFDAFERDKEYILYLREADDQPLPKGSDTPILYNTVSGPYGCVEVDAESETVSPLNGDPYLSEKLLQRFNREKRSMLQEIRQKEGGR